MFEVKVLERIVKYPRPIERRLESVFHKTEMKIWAGQNFLAAHIEFPKGQHVLS